jgi:hypothetical protein
VFKCRSRAAQNRSAQQALKIQHNPNILRITTPWSAQQAEPAVLLTQIGQVGPKPARQPVTLDDHSKVVPRLPIPNRTVKRLCADDSGHSSVKVGHRQALMPKTPSGNPGGVFLWPSKTHYKNVNITARAYGNPCNSACNSLPQTTLPSLMCLHTHATGRLKRHHHCSITTP